MTQKLVNKLNFKFSVIGKSFANILFVSGMFFLSLSIQNLVEYFDAVYFVVLLLPAFAILCSVFYIFHAAGVEPKNSKSEIRLYAIDRLWTEVAFLIVVGLLVVLAIVVFSFDPSGVAGYSFFISPILLIFLCSLFRRYKAKALYENSFLALVSRIIVISNDVLTLPQAVSITILVYLFISISGFLAALYSSVLLLCIWISLTFLFSLVMGYTIIQIRRLEKAVERFSDSYSNDTSDLIDVKSIPFFKNISQNINNSESAFSNAVKEAIKSERMKAELITNISHDIKTPLTSIISYVSLLSSSNIEDENAKKYLLILENKSKRLAQLMNDLVDVSRISSGNISVNLEVLNFEELMRQTIAEFEDRFEKNNIDIVTSPTISLFILADGRHMWRVLDNLLNNAIKYTMPHTRIYIDINYTHDNVFFIMKNISDEPLNLNPSELTERFVRGDDSRASDGSGLGLSIAESLMKAQYSSMTIDIDGDLFKTTLKLNRAFPAVEKMNVVPKLKNKTELIT